MRIYADSRGRGLFGDGDEKVKVFPGQGLSRIFEEIIKDSKEEDLGQVIVMAGIVDLTLKAKCGEILVVKEVEEGVREVERRLWRLVADTRNCKVVLATVAPMNLRIWNRRRKGYGQELKFGAHYEQMQIKLNLMVTEVNRRITSMNESRGLATPFLHSEVWCKRGKRGHVAQWWNLRDGVHPTERVMVKWRAMLVKTYARNQVTLDSATRVTEELGKLGGESDGDKEERFDKGRMERVG